jgi:hypothetical protein
LMAGAQTVKVHCEALVTVALIAALPGFVAAEESPPVKAELTDAAADSTTPAVAEPRKEQEPARPFAKKKAESGEPQAQRGQPVDENKVIELRRLSARDVVNALNARAPELNADEHVFAYPTRNALWLRTDDPMLVKRLRELIQRIDTEADEKGGPELDPMETRGIGGVRAVRSVEAEPPLPTSPYGIGSRLKSRGARGRRAAIAEPSEQPMAALVKGGLSGSVVAEPLQPPKIIRLKNSRAVEIKKILADLYPTESDALHVTADERSNLILVRGPGPVVSQFETLITELDRAPTITVVNLTQSLEGANGANRASVPEVQVVGTPADSGASDDGAAGGDPGRLDRRHALQKFQEGRQPYLGLYWSWLDRRHALQKFQERDRQASALAEEIRNLQRADGSNADPERLQKGKSELNERVAEAFDARQEWQAAELARMQDRLDRLARTIKTRAGLKSRIIERRIEELLDPDRKWEPATGSARGPDPSQKTSAADSRADAAGAAPTDPAHLRPESPFELRDELVEAERSANSAKVAFELTRNEVTEADARLQRIRQLAEQKSIDERLVGPVKLELIKAQAAMRQAQLTLVSSERQLDWVRGARAAKIKLLEQELADADRRVEQAAADEAVSRRQLEAGNLAKTLYQTKQRELVDAELQARRLRTVLDLYRKSGTPDMQIPAVPLTTEIKPGKPAEAEEAGEKKAPASLPGNPNTPGGEATTKSSPLQVEER